MWTIPERCTTFHSKIADIAQQAISIARQGSSCDNHKIHDGSYIKSCIQQNVIAPYIEAILEVARFKTTLKKRRNWKISYVY